MSSSSPGLPGFVGQSNVPPSAVTGVLRPARNIGGLVANVTVYEEHTDELAITQHPVEKTADITDHAYPLPVTLVVSIGYSPSGSGVGGGAPLGDIPDLGDPAPLQSIYEQYLGMQKGRQLLEVQTGKRLYESMLIKTLSVTTDRDTENALMITMHLQEVILVSTQTVSVPQNNVQKKPAKTGNTQNAGTKIVSPGTTYNGAQFPNGLTGPGGTLPGSANGSGGRLP